MANRRFNTQVRKPGFLKGGQVKLDANKAALSNFFALLFFLDIIFCLRF